MAQVFTDSEDDAVFLSQNGNNGGQENVNILDEARSDIELEDLMVTSNDSGNVSSEGIALDEAVQLREMVVDKNSGEGLYAKSQKYAPNVESITSDEDIDVADFFDDIPKFVSTQQDKEVDLEEVVQPKIARKSTGGPSRIAGATKDVKKSSGRSFKPPVSAAEMNVLQTVQYAKTSDKKTNWALNAYKEWRESHLATFEKPLECILGTDFEHPTGLIKEYVCDALCKFITEVRKCNEAEYPPSSVKGMILSFQRYLKSNKIGWQLLNEKDEVFRDLFYVVDNVMKARVSMGLGVVQSAEPISLPLEEEMWTKGILGEHSPVQLCETVLYVVGLNFALRGGKEHKDLRRPGFNPQITLGVDGDGVRCLRYRADPKSKTQQGGLKCKYQKPRDVTVYANPNTQRCPLRLYEKYIGLLPKTQRCKELYLHAKRRPTPNCWYDDRCWGINTVSPTVKRLMDMAGVTEGNFKNHSLRSSSLTRMHAANVPEQVMKEFSGHLSNAIRTYKTTPDSMRQLASGTVQGHITDFVNAKKVQPTATVTSSDCKVTTLVETEPSLEDKIEIPKLGKKAFEGIGGSMSDVEDFEPARFHVRTPKKRKSEVENSVSGDSAGICNFVENMCKKRKFKRIKVNLEFIDSD